MEATPHLSPTDDKVGFVSVRVIPALLVGVVVATVAWSGVGASLLIIPDTLVDAMWWAYAVLLLALVVLPRRHARERELIHKHGAMLGVAVFSSRTIAFIALLFDGEVSLIAGTLERLVLCVFVALWHVRGVQWSILDQRFGPGRWENNGS